MIMYQLEGVRDDNAVLKLFKEYCPEGVDKSASNVYVQTNSAPDFFRLIGFSYQNQDTAELERMADLISQADYDKKIDKFNTKCNKMQQKIISAKKAARAETTVGLGGFVSGNTINELLNKTEQQDNQQQTDPKVAKAQCKLDKFIDKNHMLAESKQYVPQKQGIADIYSIGASAPREKNIFETIEEAKKPKTEFLESAMAEQKDFLEKLFKLVSKVSIMHIIDGNKSALANVTTYTKLDKLTATQLANAKNRELISITK